MEPAANLPPGGIGGFIGREEVAAVSQRLFPGAVRFSTGRAALARALQRIGAKLLFVPDWMCDSVLDTARSVCCEPVPYALDQDLLPRQAPRPGSREAILILDPFGFGGARLREVAGRSPARTIVDLSQAMYSPRPPEVWAFASARKFLGVADGAFLWGPDPGPPPPPSPARDVRHLEARAAGRVDAHTLYVAHERSLGAGEYGPCADSDRLLDRLDHTRLKRIRAANFRLLHAALGGANQMPLRQCLPPDLAPLAYPYLPRGTVDHDALARHRIWVPRLWPERCADPNASALARTLAERLLPLPIDHRYGRREMEYVTNLVLKLDSEPG